MVLYLEVDQEIWSRADFTDDNTHAITGTIYGDSTFTTAFNYTGYTLKIELYNQRNIRVYEDDADIVVEANGTWRYKPSQGEFDFNFIGEVNILLSKTGTEIRAEGRKGSAKLRIR